MKMFANRRQSWIQIGGTLLVLAISAGILGYLVYSQRDLLSEVTIQVEVVPLLLAFIFFSLDLVLVAYIWGQIMNTLSEAWPVWRHVRIYFLANLAKRIPGTIWYIAGRAEIYKREGIPRRLTAGASGVEFAISLISSGIVALVFGLSILAENQLNLIGLILLLVLSLVVSHPRVMGWIFKKARVEARPFSQKEVLVWILEYLVAWVISGAVVYLVARTFISLSFDDIWFVIGSVSLANIITALLFFAPSNLGITEVTLSLLLSRIMPAPYAILVSVATRILIIAFESFWALVALWLNRGNKEALTRN